MANLHIFDGYGGGYANNPSGSAVVVTTGFQTAVNGQVTRLGWYRADTTVGHKPSQLGLFYGTGSSPVASVAPADDGAVGWQWTDLATPVDIAAGSTYYVGYYSATGWFAANPSSPYAEPTPPYPMGWGANKRAYAYAGSLTMAGATRDSSGWYGADVEFVPGASSGGSPPATGSDVANQMVAWFADTSDNTHRTADTVPGLPDRTYQDTQATKALAQGATGFDAIKAVADAISAAVGGLPGTIASAVTTITGQVISSAATITGAGLHTVGEVYDNTTTLLSHIADLMAGTSPASGSTTGRAPFPTGLWTFVDSTAFSGPLAWDVAADLYVLDVTTIPPNRPTTIGDGAPWTPRLGWWCQKNGTFFGERHFFDFPESHLQDSGRRMPGVLIWPEDGASGTIQAWVYS